MYEIAYDPKVKRSKEEIDKIVSMLKELAQLERDALK